MPTFPHPLHCAFAALTVAAALAGCAAVGPNYREPVAAVPPQWSAPLPHGGSLQNLRDWWQQAGDPVLLKLQQAAQADSPTLAAAWGNIELARATLASARSGAVPTVSANASASRSRQPGAGTASSRAASLDASWEADVFGKVRRNAESASSQLQARQGDWHDARVSLAAEVATTYVQYLACGQLSDTYAQALASIIETSQATESLVRAGLNPGNDAVLTRATQASTSSTLLGQQAQCELLVKSLANLTGMPGSPLRLLLAESGPALPAMAALAVQAVPADVVRQRPDIASRERDLAAASAAIGVAEANRYPSFKLGGSIGVSVAGSALTTWSFGPSLSLPLLDGGARQAAVDSARASYEIAYAQWRDAVRSAVTEVEKTLVQLDNAARRTTQAALAAQAYRSYLTGADAERRAGTISLLSFEEARRQALTAQVELVNLQRDNVTYGIALYKALGGGWTPSAPTTPPASRAP